MLGYESHFASPHPSGGRMLKDVFLSQFEALHLLLYNRCPPAVLLTTPTIPGCPLLFYKLIMEQRDIEWLLCAMHLFSHFLHFQSKKASLPRGKSLHAPCPSVQFHHRCWVETRRRCSIRTQPYIWRSPPSLPPRAAFFGFMIATLTERFAYSGLWLYPYGHRTVHIVSNQPSVIITLDKATCQGGSLSFANCQASGAQHMYTIYFGLGRGRYAGRLCLLTAFCEFRTKVLGEGGWRNTQPFEGSYCTDCWVNILCKF